MAELVELECTSCGHKWFPRIGSPGACPKCHKLVLGSAQQKKKSEYLRDYSREHYVGTTIDGKFVRVRVSGKRTHPSACEVCGVPDRKLGYHHWDPTDVSKGIWVCRPCHHVAQGCDSGLDAKYATKKKQVDDDWPRRKG